VEIPQGSSIASAVIHFEVISGGNNTTFTIYGQDADTGSAPTAGFSLGWTRTSASVGPNTITGTPSTYNTPDLTAIIQEIIDRPGWSSGNDLSILFFAATTPPGGTAFAAFEHATRDAAELTITFTATPIVSTEDASSISGTSAIGNGTISSTGGEDNDERGFVWGLTSLSNPGDVAPSSTDYDSNLTESGTFSTGSFTGDISNLVINTTYYYRAYSHNSLGYAYGDEVSFTTPNSTLSQFVEGMIIIAATVFFLVFLVISIRVWGTNPENLFMTSVVGFVLIIVYLNLDIV
jgi:hypothetical protein